MGAVKTNRREIALSISIGYEYRLGRIERQERAYRKNERNWLYGVPGVEETNNRRKMARLPMIRRARA